MNADVFAIVVYTILSLSALLFGYCLGNLRRVKRVLKAMDSWNVGDPGFWHTTRVFDILLYGEVTQVTRDECAKELKDHHRQLFARLKPTSPSSYS